MKKLLTLMGLLLTAIVSFAQTFTVDGLTYTVLSETDKTVQLTSDGGATGDIVVPTSVTNESVEYTVASISSSLSFQNNTNITSFTVPSSFTEFTTVGIQMFNQCTALTSVSFPTITSIGREAFYGCSSLASVSLPAATSIGNSAFGNSSNISSLRIGSVEQWCKVNFGNSYANPLAHNSQTVNLYIGDSEIPETEVVVPSTITAIPDYAFSQTTITSLTAPTTTSIGNYAFYNCSSLISVSLPVATSIGDDAFHNCSVLASVSLPVATSIGDDAFNHCSSLATVSIPVAITVGERAFYGCKSLEEALFPKVEFLGSSAFSGYSYVGDEGNYCTSLKRVSLPAATSIGDYAFYYCSSLASVSLPAATSIGSQVFWGCSNISSLRIGSVEQWCKVNFGGSYASPLQCTNQTVNLYIGDSETPATDIVVPSSVTEIPDCAFCRTTVTSLTAPAVISIGSSAFYGCSNISSLRIGSVEQWCNVNFKGDYASPLQFTSKIVNIYIGDSETPATEIVVPSTVTEIPNCAFCQTTITSLTAPEVTSIGNSAFHRCSSLTSVSIPVATSIGSQAFYYCSSLASVSLPAATFIGGYAFNGCSNISSLRIGNVEQWCKVNFENSYANPLAHNSQTVNLYIGDSEIPATDIVVPSTVTEIHDYAFRRTTITSLTATTATSIGSCAFQSCSALISVSLPAATSIGNYAFDTCPALTSVFLPIAPPSLTNTNSFPTWTMLVVPDEAYETYLATDVYKEIPLQITKEGHITETVEIEAEDGTSKLLEKISEDNVGYVVNLKVNGTINSYDMLIIRNQMTSLRNLDLTDASIVDCDYVYSTTDGASYHSEKDVITADWLSGIMYLKLPSTTTSIADKAFYNYSKLVSVNVPDGITSIGSKAFYKCNRIQGLTLPQSVTSFGQEAFYNCTGLKEVVIPDGVASINPRAFYECTDLEKVTIPASVKKIGIEAFWSYKPMELHISSLDSWLEIQMHRNGVSVFSDHNWGQVFYNVAKLNIGESTDPVEDIVIPEGTTAIKNYTFAGFKCLKSISYPESLNTIGEGTFRCCTGLSEVVLPQNLKAINSYTFTECSNLENIQYSDSIKSIGEYAFSGCSKLEKAELSPYLQTIGKYAFENCTSLTEVLIPGSLTSIGDYAFTGCSSLNTVIATTVEPVAINENTFSTYKTATLYTPKTSYYKYYWNTQYNQFLSRQEYDQKFNHHFPYEYFYLDGKNGDNKQDFEIDDETGHIHGVTDEGTGTERPPHADFHEGAGMIVEGDEIQELGNLHIHHNGNHGASVLGKGNGKVHIDNLYVDIDVQKNRWYFFSFPFDVESDNVTFPGSHVWYSYDGETRAQNGNGGWKKIAKGGVMACGNGYIFQGAINGTLSLHASDVTIDASDRKTNMTKYQSDNKNDASWNLIGNSNFAYYDLDNLNYDAPVTVYNNETGNYDAVRMGDDDYEFYPFQAFFVQKPEGTETMDFLAAHKETKNMADQNAAAKAAAKAKAPKKVSATRKVINIEITSSDLAADSVTVLSDRTRIVVNPAKSTSYETDCDAAKFIADNMPQIYSLDSEGNTYSINERPIDNGIIDLAVKTPKEGVYTISASRLDRNATLRDLETGDDIDLAKGGYTFAAKAMTYTNRFKLILSEATSIETVDGTAAAINVEAGAITVNDANADVKVYSINGTLIASQKGTGRISVPTGTYVVSVNGRSVKVTVNE